MKTEWEELPLCADCGEPLIVRYRKDTGDRFYGCSAFPECKYTESSDDDEDLIHNQ